MLVPPESAHHIVYIPGKGPNPNTPLPLPSNFLFHKLRSVLKKYLQERQHEEFQRYGLCFCCR